MLMGHENKLTLHIQNESLPNPCFLNMFVSRTSLKKHLQPVWQVIWTPQKLTGEQGTEVLVSVSADGRITKWFLYGNALDSIGTVVNNWFWHFESNKFSSRFTSKTRSGGFSI